MKTAICFFLLAILVYSVLGAPTESDAMAFGEELPVENAVSNNLDTNIEPSKKIKQVIKRRRKKVTTEPQNLDDLRNYNRKELVAFNGKVDTNTANSDLKQAISNLREKLVPFKQVILEQVNNSIKPAGIANIDPNTANNINIVIFNLITDENCTKKIENAANNVLNPVNQAQLNVSTFLSENNKVTKKPTFEYIPGMELSPPNGHNTVINKPSVVAESQTKPNGNNVVNPNKEGTSNTQNVSLNNIVSGIEKVPTPSEVTIEKTPTVESSNNIVNATLNVNNITQQVAQNNSVSVTQAPSAVQATIKGTTPKIRVTKPTRAPLSRRNKTSSINFNKWGTWQYGTNKPKKDKNKNKKPTNNWSNLNSYYRHKFDNDNTRNDKYMRGGQQKVNENLKVE